MFPSPTCACTSSAPMFVFDYDHFLLFSSFQLSSKVKPLLVGIFVWLPYRRTLSPESFSWVNKCLDRGFRRERRGCFFGCHNLTLRMVMAFQKSCMILSILWSYLIGTTGKRILPFLLIGQSMVNTIGHTCCGLCGAMEITDVEVELTSSGIFRVSEQILIPTQELTHFHIQAFWDDNNLQTVNTKWSGTSPPSMLLSAKDSRELCCMSPLPLQ